MAGVGDEPPLLLVILREGLDNPAREENQQKRHGEQSGGGDRGAGGEEAAERAQLAAAVQKDDVRLLPGGVDRKPVVVREAPRRAGGDGLRGVVDGRRRVDRRNLPGVDGDHAPALREEDGEIPRLIRQLGRKAAAFPEAILPAGRVAEGEGAVVLPQDGEDAVRVRDEGRVVQNARDADNHGEHEQQGQERGDDQLGAQLPYHAISSSVYPALRTARIRMFACRAASFLRR